MKRLTFKLAIALSTFMAGVLVTGLLTIYSFRLSKKIPVSSPPGAVIKVNTPDGWKKVDVNKMFTLNAEKMFSFYLPSDMREIKRSDTIDLGQPAVIYLNNTLSFVYRIIDKAENERLWHGKESCGSWAAEISGMSMSRSSEVEIGGRRATQAFWISDDHTSHRMTLCFPDIGDGTILKFWAHPNDERSLDVAEQIINTIEFQ